MVYNGGSITNVTFSSNNTHASVSPLSNTSSPYKTLATALSVGNATITATATMNTGAICSCVSTVNVVESTNIEVHHDGASGTQTQANCKAFGWINDPDSPGGSRLYVIYANGAQIYADKIKNIGYESKTLAITSQ
jgi:hypothetical protein